MIDLGILPTPAFYFAKQRAGRPGGVMVTASHNPARYNGFKLMFGDLPVTPEGLQALAAADGSAALSPPGQGTCRQEEMLADYAPFLVPAFPGLRAARLVVDAGNGSMWQVAPARAAPARARRWTSSTARPTAPFPTATPTRRCRSTWRDCASACVATGAELGVAYDGDGDRVIFVDERGRVLPADRTLVLLVRHLLAAAPGRRGGL